MGFKDPTNTPRSRAGPLPDRCLFPWLSELQIIQGQCPLRNFKYLLKQIKIPGCVAQLNSHAFSVVVPQRLVPYEQIIYTRRNAMGDATADKPTDARTRLLAHFSGDTAAHSDRWSELWDKGDFLPWDRGTPNPALEDVLAHRQDLIGDRFARGGEGGKRRKKALVPGCGRGYDVLLLASFGYDVYGLDLSESAVQMCRREQDTNGHKYPVRDVNVGGAGKITFLTGDFFGDAWSSNIDGGPVFELIYDYTVDAAASAGYIRVQRGQHRIHANPKIVPLRSSTFAAPSLVIENVHAAGPSTLFPDLRRISHIQGPFHGRSSLRFAT